jgi:outer membrane protein assembly factor BamB
MKPARSFSPSTLLIFSLLLSAVPAAPVAAGDWPQWRGPSADGSSPEKDLPTTWSATENVAWKLELPARSGATPVVADGRVYLPVGYEPETNDDLELWAVDAGDGSVLWKRTLGSGNQLKRKHHMSSPSPVTDGERVWVMTGTGLVYAFAADGERLWRRDLQDDYGDFGLLWGYASSPLLHEGSLYVQVLHGFNTDDPSYVLRLDAATGETRWRVERPTQAVREAPDAYTTPAVATVGDREELIVSGGDVVTGHDLTTGKELWRAAGINPDGDPSGRVVASPVVIGRTVLAFGKRGPVVALRTGGTGDVSSSLAWKMDKGTDVPTPATDGRLVYMVDDRGIAWALAPATGEVVWGPERLPAGGNYSASPVVADGKVYAVSEEGVTTVLKAGPKFEVLAENDLGGYVLSSPAVAGGRIYLRTDEYLWAVGVKPETPPAPAKGG